MFNKGMLKISNLSDFSSFFFFFVKEFSEWNFIRRSWFNSCKWYFLKMLFCTWECRVEIFVNDNTYILQIEKVLEMKKNVFISCSLLVSGNQCKENKSWDWFWTGSVPQPYLWMKGKKLIISSIYHIKHNIKSKSPNF